MCINKNKKRNILKIEINKFKKNKKNKIKK